MRDYDYEQKVERYTQLRIKRCDLSHEEAWLLAHFPMTSNHLEPSSPRPTGALRRLMNAFEICAEQLKEIDRQQTRGWIAYYTLEINAPWWANEFYERNYRYFFQ